MRIAIGSREKLERSKRFSKPINTPIIEEQTFYPAEEYHQNYFNQNKGAGYCQFVVAPKVE